MSTIVILVTKFQDSKSYFLLQSWEGVTQQHSG